MRSVSFKLAVGFAAVALVGVLIIGYLANRLTASEFGNYLDRGSLAMDQRAAEIVADRYSSGGWQGVSSTLMPLSHWMGMRLIVADSAGIVVADSAGELTGGRVPAPTPGRAVPIVVGGRVVGDLHLLPDPRMGSGMMGSMMGSAPMGSSSMMGMMRQLVDQSGSSEQRFLEAVNQALWFAGAVALAVALLVGLLISRQITAPLHRLTLAARRVARGDLSQRVDIRSGDELASLAEAFNTMAATLESNEQQRRRLLSDIAHELKTPLSIVQGNLEAMMDGIVEATPERLASLREETLLLSRLVTDLRDLSLAEAGQLHLRLEPVGMSDLVRAAVAGIQAQADDRRIRLETDLPEGLPPVLADADRIGQVLRNLLGNALRYTPRGGSIRVSLSGEGDLGSAAARRADAVGRDGRRRAAAGSVGDGAVLDRTGAHPAASGGEKGSREAGRPSRTGWVKVSVVDTGSGIPAEDLPRIFDRFYRVDKSRARSSGGSGLGLSVARQLVEAHGGRIWAESEAGRGSAFHFVLPVAGPGTDILVSGEGVAGGTKA